MDRNYASLRQRQGMRGGHCQPLGLIQHWAHIHIKWDSQRKYCGRFPSNWDCFTERYFLFSLASKLLFEKLSRDAEIKVDGIGVSNDDIIWKAISERKDVFIYYLMCLDGDSRKRVTTLLQAKYSIYKFKYLYLMKTGCLEIFIPFPLKRLFISFPRVFMLHVRGQVTRTISVLTALLLEFQTFSAVLS